MVYSIDSDQHIKFNTIISDCELRGYKGQKGLKRLDLDQLDESWNYVFRVPRNLLVTENDDARSLDDKLEDWRVLGVRPSFQIYSGGKSIHHYWLLDVALSDDVWAKAQRSLADKLGGDQTLSDLGQCMRLPGTKHPQGKLCRFLGDIDKVYKLEDLGLDLGGETNEGSGKKTGGGVKLCLDSVVISAVRWIASALGPYVKGQGTYGHRLKVATYLKQTGNEDLWVELFDGCDRSSPQDFLDSLGEPKGEIGIGSIAYIARDLGWIHPIAEDPDCIGSAIWPKDIDLKGYKPLEAKRLKRLDAEARIAKKQGLVQLVKVRADGSFLIPTDYEIYRWITENENHWAYDECLYVWGGFRWEIADEKKVTENVLRTVKVLEEYGGLTNRLINSIVTQLLKYHPRKLIDTGELAFTNGVLNFQDKTLKPPSPENFNRTCLSFDYKPGDCTNFLNWLKDIQPNPQAQKLLIAFLKVCLVGRNATQQFFLELTGTGGSGKSTFANLAQALVGADNIHTTSPDRLEGERFSLLPIVGKKLLVLNDISNYRKDLKILKSLVGSDQLTAEVKGQNTWINFRFKGCVLVVGEQTLRSNDYQSGLNRRRIQIRFQQKFSQPVEILELGARGITGLLADELPAIAAYVLDNAEEGLLKPCYAAEIDKDWHREQLEEQNPLADYLLNSYVFEETASLYLGSANAEGIYTAYLQYCSDLRIEAVNLKRFSREMVDVANNILGWDVSKVRDSKGIKINGLKRSVDK